MKFVDTHAHLCFKAFEKDWLEVQQRTIAADVGTINVGTQADTSAKAVHIAEVFQGKPVWAAVGQHPIHAIRHEFDPLAFRDLAGKDDVVAVGEVGLDYFRLQTTYHDPNEEVARDDEQEGEVKSIELAPDEVKEKQVYLFGEFITIARDVQKPLIVHVRDEAGKYEAYDDVLAILKNTGSGLGVAHCFGGDWEHAKKFLDVGFMIGITGIATFPKSDVLAEVVRHTPLERLLLETDSPYLTPAPHRGQRNEPLYTEFVGRRVAELKGLSADEVFSQTTENAIRLFGLKW
ncbi:MAG: TatD family hydrolase [Candidatus Kerfeldbacteria bacterium]|nr:TatD family hydrolase [Candidatus Kerfeldbacteria bacterium]